MPIRIDDHQNDWETVAYLCDDDWTVTPQLYALDEWLKESGRHLEPSDYVADIGIDGVEKTATGGGGVLSVEALQIMASIGMELWISEYGEGVLENEEIPKRNRPEDLRNKSR